MELLHDKWHKQLPSKIVPSLPITFRAIIKASAKDQNIGSLKTELHKIHSELYPVESLTFDDEFNEKSGSILL